jgi:hypothetical protein
MRFTHIFREIEAFAESTKTEELVMLSRKLARPS